MIFSKRGFERRYERARELMREKRVDALFITGEENYHYFTGGADISVYRSFSRPHVVVVPLDGEPIVVVSDLFTPVLREAGAVRDIRTYTSVHGIPNELLVTAVKDTNLQHNRIGAEFGLEQRLGMPYRDFVNLTESLPRVEFVDASDIIWKLRMVKSKEEVELMRKACNITGRARQKTFDEIEAGVTERDIARVFSKNMLQEGADRVSFVHVSSKQPTNHTYLYLEREIGVGDTIYLDGGAYYWTYTCDFPRLATVGRASEKQIRYHKILTEVNRKMADALRPGLKCSELYRIGVRLMKEAGGIGELPLKTGRIGHGQGMLLTEPPSVAADDDTVIEPGFTLSTEPGFGDGLHIWEDVHVVTDDGHEQLSRETEELREI